MKNVNSVLLSAELEQYLEELAPLESFDLQELESETIQNIHGSHMISGKYQGRVLSMISKLIQPQNILEIGTFTGYSALCLAEGLQIDGQLVSLELNENLKPLHDKYLTPQGNIKVLYGNALETLETLDTNFDLIFIDADKANYISYYKKGLSLLNKNGVILADNILWRGKVAYPIDENDKHSKVIKNIVAFNQFVNQDDSVEQIILPIRDGISIIRKK